MLKADLHVHTSLSDGDDLKRVLSYARIKGLNVLAMTDHNTLRSIKVAKLINDPLVIPGIEINYDFAHILILGVDENFKVKLDFYEVIDTCEDNGYVTILAHPAIFMISSRNYVKRNYNRIRLLNAIETYNSMYPYFNLMRTLSEKLANTLKLAKVGGSDAHKAEHVGNCYTLLDSEKNADEVLKAIAKGRTRAYGRPSPLIDRLKLPIRAMRHFISVR